MSWVQMEAEVIANHIGGSKLWEEKGINFSLQDKKENGKWDTEIEELLLLFIILRNFSHLWQTFQSKARLQSS